MSTSNLHSYFSVKNFPKVSNSHDFWNMKDLLEREVASDCCFKPIAILNFVMCFSYFQAREMDGGKKGKRRRWRELITAPLVHSANAPDSQNWGKKKPDRKESTSICHLSGRSLNIRAIHIRLSNSAFLWSGSQQQGQDSNPGTPMQDAVVTSGIIIYVFNSHSQLLFNSFLKKFIHNV